jgi:hypothetical protein
VESCEVEIGRDAEVDARSPRGTLCIIRFDDLLILCRDGRLQRWKKRKNFLFNKPALLNNYILTRWFHA